MFRTHEAVIRHIPERQEVSDVAKPYGVTGV
jgi:hypothetical protein